MDHDHDISSAMYAQLMTILKCQYTAESNADGNPGSAAKRAGQCIGGTEMTEDSRELVADRDEGRAAGSGMGEKTKGEQKQSNKVSRRRSDYGAEPAGVEVSGAGEGEGVLSR